MIRDNVVRPRPRRPYETLRAADEGARLIRDNVVRQRQREPYKLRLTDSYSPNGAKAFSRGRKPPGNSDLKYQPRRGESTPPMTEKPSSSPFAPLGLDNITALFRGLTPPAILCTALRASRIGHFEL